MSAVLIQQTYTGITLQEPIHTLQQLWDASLDYKMKGFLDTDAMRKVYKALNPKLTLNDVAFVFSGVYANSYWNITFMDAGLLADSLRRAFTLPPALAGVYAQKAISKWRGILCRKNMNGTGIIPHSDDATCSTDVFGNQHTEPDTGDLSLVAGQNPLVGKGYVYFPW